LNIFDYFFLKYYGIIINIMASNILLYTDFKNQIKNAISIHSIPIIVQGEISNYRDTTINQTIIFNCNELEKEIIISMVFNQNKSKEIYNMFDCESIEVILGKFKYIVATNNVDNMDISLRNKIDINDDIIANIISQIYNILSNTRVKSARE